MLYVFALEPFLRRLKANPVFPGITLPGGNAPAKYSAYVSVPAKRTAEINEVSKEICRYEKVAGAKINCDKSACGWVNGREFLFPGPSVGRTGRLSVCFGHDLQLRINWLEVRKKVEEAVYLWTRRNLSLKGRRKFTLRTST